MDVGKDYKTIVCNAPNGWTHCTMVVFTYLKVVDDHYFSVYNPFVEEWGEPTSVYDIVNAYGLGVSDIFTREEIEQAAGVAPAVSVDSHYQKYVYRVKLSDQDVKNGFVDVKLDPYRVASVCGVGGGALEHCLKKAMRGTDKGHDLRYVYNEIIKAAMRGIEMIDEDLK